MSLREGVAGTLASEITRTDLSFDGMRRADYSGSPIAPKENYAETIQGLNFGVISSPFALAAAREASAP